MGTKIIMKNIKYSELVDNDNKSHQTCIMSEEIL